MGIQLVLLAFLQYRLAGGRYAKQSVSLFMIIDKVLASAFVEVCV